MTSTHFWSSIRNTASLAALALMVGLGSGPAMAQMQPTISVPEFKNDTSNSSSDWWWWSSSAPEELAEALSNELTATGNFRVVERQNLRAVLSEQELVELGIVRPNSGAQTGQVTGAQYIILGKVTSYEENVKNETTGLEVGGIRIGNVSLGGSGRGSSTEAYVAIDLRVVDSTTGEVLYARTVEGNASSDKVSGDGNVSFNGVTIGGDRTEENNAPVGRALRAALIEATDYLSCAMVEQDNCLSAYEAKDEQRRESTRSILDLF